MPKRYRRTRLRFRKKHRKYKPGGITGHRALHLASVPDRLFVKTVWSDEIQMSNIYQLGGTLNTPGINQCTQIAGSGFMQPSYGINAGGCLKILNGAVTAASSTSTSSLPMGFISQYSLYYNSYRCYGSKITLQIMGDNNNAVYSTANGGALPLRFILYPDQTGQAYPATYDRMCEQPETKNKIIHTLSSTRPTRIRHKASVRGIYGLTKAQVQADQWGGSTGYNAAGVTSPTIANVTGPDVNHNFTWNMFADSPWTTNAANIPVSTVFVRVWVTYFIEFYGKQLVIY